MPLPSSPVACQSLRIAPTRPNSLTARRSSWAACAGRCIEREQNAPKRLGFFFTSSAIQSLHTRANSSACPSQSPVNLASWGVGRVCQGYFCNVRLSLRARGGKTEDLKLIARFIHSLQSLSMNIAKSIDNGGMSPGIPSRQLGVFGMKTSFFNCDSRNHFCTKDSIGLREG